MKYIIKYRDEIIFILIAVLILVPGFYFGVVSRQITVRASANLQPEEESMTAVEIITEMTTAALTVTSTETTQETSTVIQVDDTPGVIVVPNLVPADRGEEISEITTEEEAKGDVCSIMVSGSTILGKNSANTYDMEGDGTLYSNYEAEIREGDTAFSILERELVLNSILIEYNITNSVRVTKVAGLGEGDFGELSGWKYKVNGVFPDIESDKYVIKPGDVVEWVYTCDGGNDIGYTEESGENTAEENTLAMEETETYIQE